MEESPHLIVCDRLTKIYGKSETKALDSVSFSVPSSGVFVLIGRNGSGKTTLVRILATELEPTSGTATIGGIDVVKAPRDLREKIDSPPGSTNNTLDDADANSAVVPSLAGTRLLRGQTESLGLA